MKVLMIATLTALVSMSNAHAVEFVAADNSHATKLCMAFASDRPHVMLKALRGQHTAKPRIANKLECNDMSLDEFAQVYSLTRTAKFMKIDLETKTSIKDIAKTETSLPAVLTGSK
ncbi:DUF3718 domain-containing protein [Pseudoalteromonas luteoviolacea]|uniref:DUF3718 domain-containing protein n=1 Tax=Pseudoalteromonas luteoviolacea S4054 TaxID=1129367 RepID=A0A0F6AGH2_9GAMM|nr:DUF3718 domain-containing protein [Pseudoalteromonas luteoviolacea]AOT08106.1 hypothetical protein S4054249_09725 [Pseudoalteromonas luteoviolacea]AOT13023.1 hypothetical protein S40542_09725 [Pseudoalteromonas luteoviolacea]AOT17935.1 hypothetical protein S4054_09720 [Pseudoalteromonas luteoviolacea]KKE84489.1 hypothetical protein N479_08685 [Pseudoalteromonas luteoviolacea S4054]KZN69537.1 hypothetical protein N481_22355 [Pseudoalteromonas luteoviolacea S4047-1]